MIKINECGEMLVSINQVSSKIKVRGEKTVFLRKSVCEMLINSAERLAKSWQFLVISGWRSKPVQKYYFDTYYKRFKNQEPHLSEKDLLEKISKYVHPYEGPIVSGHMTGGALDLTLIESDGSKILLNDKNLSFEENAKMFSKKIDQEILKNRKIFYENLVQSGLVNYPAEYWHWSYGDRLWAELKGEDTAIYGVVKKPVK